MTSLLFTGKNKIDVNQDATKLHPLICTTFFFAYVWAIGGNLITKSMEAFDSFARELFGDTNDVKVSIIFFYTIIIICSQRSLAVEKCLIILWTLRLAGLSPGRRSFLSSHMTKKYYTDKYFVVLLKLSCRSHQVPYFDILVPTIDTVRFGFLLEKLLDVNHSVLYTGTTGVGKVSYSHRTTHQLIHIHINTYSQ